MTSPWLTPDEAATYCRVSLSTFLRWVATEGIRADGVVGKRNRYLPQTLDGLMRAIAKRPKHRVGVA
jgi:excisionase family DNA binding protein